ncbi:hypothetical protein RHHCN13_05970 [Rickettsia conorii subsp. heilongjiangensis]|uniref:Uncharacterized protein n=1 Tax=Rickettsia conorii subsp. heilongjiangensis TaxID=226665 RepID=A0AAD1GJM6_RICCR|nr:DUF5460 family protein [Rickettsia conorii]AEK75148.1 hypothetical protein Rh054_06435 [Rickettsia conorii subsp. heilongjiangensis 054]BBM91880.1 hypothetical protein RHCH81_05970 [Rickettsia conorii subsp. heilongjiangensis]BBM93089.1 hypothetical protein RHHCN13_05970 [Rickettsia conorii subsp. heilongjiangensis]BBM94298.1 hypothetical protein RHSENDAI29_05970 [Rickettsia conorii subsp. heilongjiangensis]BBM95507.1 hypothetical protein RHSENDAI58_05970 [Rickettsia conorii subsp. heilongj
MVSILNINFKCVMPIFSNEIVSRLPGNVSHIIHKLSNTIFSSVYSTVEGAFKKGYIVDHTQCNWKNIEQSFNESPNDFSILHQECNNGLNIPINNIFIDAENNPHILLQQTVTPHQNGTVSILSQLYKVTNDYIFSQGNITETSGADFLGLNECTKEEAMSALQNYNAYKETLIPRESFINTLKNTLNHLGLSLDNVSPTEIGKDILDQLGQAYTDPTTERPNDDTNDGGYSGVYIAGVALGTLAVGTILGYCIKYGWDWYKGRNIKNETLDLVMKNKELQFVELLHENFKKNAVIFDEVIKINNLHDIIKLAKSIKEYEFAILPLTNLNNEIVKLNSPSAIAINLDSSSGILHEICKSLGGDDSFQTINNFARLITIIRTANPKSEEYKESIIEIFEIFNHSYTDIDYPNCEIPLLADVSSPYNSLGIEV